MHLSLNPSGDYIADAQWLKTLLCDHSEGGKPLYCTEQQQLKAPPKVWLKRALDCTRRSAVHLTVLHPALFHHVYMSCEKFHRHEKNLENILELKFICINVHSWFISVVDSNKICPVWPVQVSQSNYENLENEGAMGVGGHDVFF